MLRMRDIVDLLLHSLLRKGLRPRDAKKLIKQVLYVLNDGGETSLEVINQRLESFGWDEEILNEYTLGLIVCLLFDLTKHNAGVYVEESDRNCN
jgi:hypothetical protein